MKVQVFKNKPGPIEGKEVRVLGYCRVSTIRQETNTSLQVQREVIENYCKAQGWHLVHVYQDISSGSNLDRFGISILEQRLNDENLAGVVVSKLDRFSRSILDAWPFINRLTDGGKFLLSISEGINSTQPASKLILNLLFTFAEAERDRITERMTEGRNAHLKTTGQKPSGKLPIGYRRDRQGKAVFDEPAATLVRETFRLKNAGKSYRQIAKQVFNDQISHVAVFHIIRNQYYLGEIHWHTGKGNNGGEIIITEAHAPLVSKRLWNLVNGLTHSRKAKKGFVRLDNAAPDRLAASH
ncbi:hypothetical protein ES705_32221 [subsurface metagenome]